MEALIGIVLFVILYGLIVSGVGWFAATCYNLALAEPFGWPTLTWWQGALILLWANTALVGMTSAVSNLAATG